MTSLPGALRARKFVQWTIGYSAGAWVAFEIVSQVSETFGLAPVVGRVTFVVLVALVPAVAVVAWFHGEKGRQRVSVMEVVLLGGIAVAGAITVAEVVRSAEDPPSPQDSRTTLARLDEATASIAVLPFVNLSGQDEDEYFSDGVSEELLNVLAQLPNLRVAARSSSFAYKGTSPNIPDVARALDVDWVLEGSIRRAGDNVRVTAQLIDASGFHAWSETYERELTPENLFAVEDEIVREVSRELDVRMDRSDFLSRRPTNDPAAYDMVLRAMSLARSLSESDAREALALFQNARSRDPSYAAAHVGEGLTLLVLAAGGFLAPSDAYPPALDAANRALALEPDWSAALALRARIRMNWEWRIEEAYEDTRRAVELNPNDPNNYLAYVQYWSWRGEPSRGCDAIAAARRVDPLSAGWASYLATCLTWIGDFENAIRAQKEAEELDPGIFFFDASVGNAYGALGRFDEAVELFDRAEYVMGQPSANFAAFLHQVDSTHLAIEKLEELERIADSGRYVRAEGIAAAWWTIGDRERAVEWWERGLQAHSSGMIMLRMIEQALGAPEGIPEFRELSRRYGVPIPEG